MIKDAWTTFECYSIWIRNIQWKDGFFESTYKETSRSFVWIFVKIILMNNQCSLRSDGTCIIYLHRNLLTIIIPPLSRILLRIYIDSFEQHLYIHWLSWRRLDQKDSFEFVVFRKRNGVVTRVRPRDERPARRKYEEEIRGGMHGRRKRNRRDASPITDFLPFPSSLYKIHLTSAFLLSLSLSLEVHPIFLCSFSAFPIDSPNE